MMCVKKIREMEQKEEGQGKIAVRKKPKKPNGFFENPQEPKKPDNDNDNEDDNDNDLLSKEEKEEKLKLKIKSCLNTSNQEMIRDCSNYLDRLPFSVIDWVLVRTSGIEKPNWNYAKKVLDDFVKRKIDSLEKIEEDQERYKKSKNRKGIFKYSQREYGNLDFLYANIK